MSKNLLITILLSSLILYGGLYIQSRFFSPPTSAIEQSVNEPAVAQADNRIVPDPAQESNPEKEVVINTDAFSATFSTKNAVLTSLVALTKTGNSISEIELVVPGSMQDTFKVNLGSDENLFAGDVFFSYELDTTQKQIRFSRDFINKRNGQEFTLTKSFLFKKNEHLFELSILLQNKKNELLDLGDTAYTLYFGPQLGPLDEVISTQKSRQISLRRFVGYSGGKRQNINVKKNEELLKTDSYKWIGILGRYFTLIMMPNSARYETVFSAYDESGLTGGSQIQLHRKNIRSTTSEDVHRIYLGPKTREALLRYNDANTNEFALANAEIDKAVPSRLLGFLERIWLFILRFMYSIIPNYGIAIIILTLFIRLLSYPILRKSKQNGEKMKLLSPKLKEIKEKYPNDSGKQSQEIMQVYKTYGFSPLSSFLPILIQLPIFLSMYRVISESFEFYKAPFFGWIIDLSKPDGLFSFNSFEIPLLGWREFHLLPLIMLGTQFLSSYILTKQQQGQNMGSQKLMFILSYVFPFIIFFALYNSPSGLILYWITSNFVTVLTIFDTNTKKQVKLIPVKKKEIPSWKKYLKQGRREKR